LDSKTEADSFRKVLTKNAALVDNYYAVYVGATLSQLKNSSSFTWVATNNPLRFNLTWDAGQPNNLYFAQSCLGLTIAATVGSVYAYNDLECDDPNRILPFICQKVKP